MKKFFKFILWLCIVPMLVVYINWIDYTWDKLPQNGESVVEYLFPSKDTENDTFNDNGTMPEQPEETTPVIEETMPLPEKD